ncbi:MAG: hypothetical protein ACFE8E_13535 [Candidatus Hodarchaeota archaeon]
MNLTNTSTFWKKHRRTAGKKKQFMILLMIFTIMISTLFFLKDFSRSDGNLTILENEIDNREITSPNSADIGYLFQDPFKQNFEEIWQFFRSNYVSDLELDIDTYYREGNNVGTILDDKVYPIDNLLLYKSLLKEDITPTETYNNYLKLKESPLWFEGNVNQYKYGFVKSVDNSTKEVFDDNRYLVDNLMPIFLLIENIGAEIDNINVGGTYPKDSIEEAFFLLNSSEFWDYTNEGFYHHNSTTDKYTESNLYAILANLELNKLYKKLNIAPTIRNRAFELAETTMNRLLLEVWDQVNGGFEYYALNNWNTGSNYKYLHVNALGIITLIEFWKETGMENDTYLQLAEYLFNKLEVMWDTGFNGYEYNRDGVWDISGANPVIELEANSIMLTACLKLFETTGNITYYNRAWQLHETFENDFYDGGVNAYRLSIDSPINNNKNFYANLRLSEAYLYAFEIYNSTIINAEYNVSETIPDYIFNQESMNITSSYAFEKEVEYFNNTEGTYETYKSIYNIDTADISYLFKFPNGTLLEKRERQILGDSITLIYNINDSMPIGNGYYLHIYANSSVFATAITLKRYNIISGLVNIRILGLPSTLYQGPTLNVTLQINNTRKDDVTLNTSMEGYDIFNETKMVYFPSMVITNISFNLRTVLDANLGPNSIIFQLQKNNVLYLEIIRSINIGYSFDYSNFFYESSSISGGSIDLSITLINFLPNSSQYVNISFSGDYLTQELVDEIGLLKSEIRTLYYTLNLAENITLNTIDVEMNIKKGDTIFYSELFTIHIIKKYEILSVTFPDIIPQGEYAYFIMVIRNNQEISELFSLYANGERIIANINGLSPGENRIIARILPTINPYDFETKSYTFALRDSSNEIIAQYFFQVKVELTAFNFVVFYLLPIIIPISIVLFYKSKEIKHKLLRR